MPQAARGKRRAALARSQGAQEKVKDQLRREEAAQGAVLAGAPSPGAETEELYFASILICDVEVGDLLAECTKSLAELFTVLRVSGRGRGWRPSTGPFGGPGLLC